MGSSMAPFMYCRMTLISLLSPALLMILLDETTFYTQYQGPQHISEISKLFKSLVRRFFSLSPQATCTWPSSMPPMETCWTSYAKAECWRPIRHLPLPTAPLPHYLPNSCFILQQMWPGGWIT